MSLAFVERRQHRRASNRDVLGSVSLIREIDPGSPHRAHLEILNDLRLEKRLEWIAQQRLTSNFDGLLAAWLNALDTEELNRRFYADLFAWFERAAESARFPLSQSNELSDEEHVIRLITRMLFVWFMKEKGLVAEELFVEGQVKGLLQGYDDQHGDSYYRAVLQNLFFGTLNTDAESRGFHASEDSSIGDSSSYRFLGEIADPEALLALFAKTPFINGGIFDCLDRNDTSIGECYIDSFAEGLNLDQSCSIPNWLFFDQSNSSPGLITLFGRYKFTIEENTPAEKEVALDPELLGKAFENLLAAFNPETRDTARKQTGSYYTPRTVVDYMVDEALVATLVRKVDTNSVDADWWEDRLRYLLDYSAAFDDARELFTDTEIDSVVRAIANIKILDPAVGSGAFPMGVLNKLTMALRRLDPDNVRWESLQKELASRRAIAAFDTSDQSDRDAELTEISETFERYRDSDYGRKLYLIQNSIFGVDIQPVATQIARLRFFISLAIDQRPNPRAANFGFEPLPNLETRFVTADSLIGLGGQMSLAQTGEVRALNQKLDNNRERHFHADKLSEKVVYRRRDKRLRLELAEALRAAEMPGEDAYRVSEWDPYDQNSAAAWFDPLYMFGVDSGFDIVIGNPPYVESRNSLISDDAKDLYLAQVQTDWGATVARGSDLLVYFIARSAALLSADRGTACLITQNAWLSTNYGKTFQSFCQRRIHFRSIIDTSAKFFSDLHGPNINAVIGVFGRDRTATVDYAIANADMMVTRVRSFNPRSDLKWGHLIAMSDEFGSILSALKDRESQSLRKSVRIGQGINIAKSDIGAPGADVPVLVQPAHFVANTPDNAVPRDVVGRRAAVLPALIMPRGIGRYFCAFNACRAHSLSGVELYLGTETWGSDYHYCLWLYLNSSFAWLFREITGRRNLGGGMLKAEATDLKSFPIGFRFDFADEARALYDQLQNRSPLKIGNEVETPEHLAIDDLVSEYFGFSVHSDLIREELVNRVSMREDRASYRG